MRVGRHPRRIPGRTPRELRFPLRCRNPRAKRRPSQRRRLRRPADPGRGRRFPKGFASPRRIDPRRRPRPKLPSLRLPARRSRRAPLRQLQWFLRSPRSPRLRRLRHLQRSPPRPLQLRRFRWRGPNRPASPCRSRHRRPPRRFRCRPCRSLGRIGIQRPKSESRSSRSRGARVHSSCMRGISSGLWSWGRSSLPGSSSYATGSRSGSRLGCGANHHRPPLRGDRGRQLTLCTGVSSVLDRPPFSDRSPASGSRTCDFVDGYGPDRVKLAPIRAIDRKRLRYEIP